MRFLIASFVKKQMGNLLNAAVLSFTCSIGHADEGSVLPRVFEFTRIVRDGEILTSVTFGSEALTINNQYNRFCYANGQAKLVEMTIPYVFIDNLSADERRGLHAVMVELVRTDEETSQSFVTRAKNCGGTDYGVYVGSIIFAFLNEEDVKAVVEFYRANLD